MGLPVLAAGRARYSLVEAVEAPAKREDYSGKLAGWLAADQIEQNENYRENARKFLYFELYRSSLDFSSYLIPDKTLAGFVSLSHFDPEQLLEDPNGVLSVLRNGILNGTPFNDTSLDLNAIHNAS